ncbi:hypothetical protein IT402_01335 [Candidatus Nomurabacteria bacterium]|nr:hypothetical protein [Candidatus Nomurabacteria bacterium]
MSNKKPKLAFVSAISPQPGNLYTETMFYKPKRTLRFETSSSLEVAVFPYGFGTFKLTWSEEVADLKTAKETTNPDGSKKYSSYREFLNSNLVIGYRTEYVKFFKEVESHPFVVESTSAEDGVSSEIVINIIVKINYPKDGGPLKILKLNDPFGFIFGFINEAIVRWANSKNSKDIRRMSTDASTKPFEEIKINDTYYLDYLNENKFKSYEIEVIDVNLKTVVLSERSKDVLEGEQKVVIAKSATEEAEETKKKRVLLSEAKDAENKVELSFIKGDLEAKEKFLKNSSDALQKINNGYASGTKLRTLVIGSENDILSKLITATKVANESEKGGKS